MGYREQLVEIEQKIKHHQRLKIEQQVLITGLFAQRRRIKKLVELGVETAIFSPMHVDPAIALPRPVPRPVPPVPKEKTANELEAERLYEGSPEQLDEKAFNKYCDNGGLRYRSRVEDWIAAGRPMEDKP